METLRFATYELAYRVAWRVKTADDVLDDTERDRIADLLEEVADDHDLEIREKTVRSDHVHLTVTSPPRHSPRILANWLKGLSASRYNHRYEDSEQKIRWSSEYFLTTRGGDEERLEEALEAFLDDDIEAYVDQ